MLSAVFPFKKYGDAFLLQVHLTSVMSTVLKEKRIYCKILKLLVLLTVVYGCGMVVMVYKVSTILQF